MPLRHMPAHGHGSVLLLLLVVVAAVIQHPRAARC